MLQLSRHRRSRKVGNPVSTDVPALVNFSISIVITCKGRLDHLRTCLRHTLRIVPRRAIIVVVDYGDPDGAFDYCVSLHHPQLIAMKVLDGTEIFNLSRARNCGANTLGSDILCFVDADSILHPDFFDQATSLIRANRATLTRRGFVDQRNDTCGVCCVSTAAYRKVRGYDEMLEGWGPEDLDFYKRIGRMGIVHQFSQSLYPTTLEHSDRERTRFYQEKDRLKSASNAVRRLMDPGRAVNSNGYGRASVELSAPAFIKPIISVVSEENCDLVRSPDSGLLISPKLSA